MTFKSKKQAVRYANQERKSGKKVKVFRKDKLATVPGEGIKVFTHFFVQ